MATDDKDKRARLLSKLLRDWHLSFNVTDNAVEFIERLEELIEASKVEQEDILQALPRILQGKALLWYRNNVKSWETWEEFLELFKLYYFPSNYEEDLIARIVARKQKFREKFTDYVTDLQTLMRRCGKLTDVEQLHRIHENMLTKYKLYIKQQDYKNLPGLLKLAADYENIITDRDSGEYRPYYNKSKYSGGTSGSTSAPGAQGRAGPSDDTQPRKTESYETNSDDKTATTRKIHPKYDAKICCWSCGKPGHDAKVCRSKQQIFCSTCGKQGILSKNCCKKERVAMRESLSSASEKPREDNRAYIDVEIMGTTYKCLVDTGSTNTYINEEIYKKCVAAAAMVANKPRNVILANGECAQVSQNVLVDIKCKGITLKHWLRVLPTATCVIVGMDILRRVGMEIHWKSEEAAHQIREQETHQTTSTPMEGLTKEQENILAATLNSEFELCENSPKGNTWVQHKMKLKHREPIKQRYYPRNPKQQEIIDKHVKEMLEQGVIEKSDSPYSSPVVLVKKENGEHRFCIDFRKINEISEKDAYPLPQIDDTLEKLRSAQFFSKFDLKNGYWNVKLEDDSKPITAFTVPGRGLYQFKVMPFGLHSSGATFQRLLDRVIAQWCHALRRAVIGFSCS